ncbi:E3 ubiquitin-protein ligase RFWD3-like [Tribolium madens]|uniref:E3 ubiquitin-protein ligase RFWD3-like n=1 Tax=Tribolium madens TaxID=41895 RepID=UPI001CF73288|nr:E3 ubiquitin-protein ligase RFWD3-like [Tribolium madens]
MNLDDYNHGENEMDVEGSEEFPMQIISQPPLEEIHPLALVAINVDNNVRTNNHNVVEFPIVPQNIVEVNEIERLSPAESVQNFDEESNQNNDSNEPIQTSRKRTYEVEEREEDGSVCPICLDEWTNTGSHRICALKCGHLFGFQCISRWLDQNTKKSCPTCKEKARQHDIRFIYAKKLTAIDTTELDNIKQQLDTVIEQRNKFQTELATCVYREQLLKHEIAQLKTQLSSFTRQNNVPTFNQPMMERVKLYMDKAMEICKFGGSRVFDARCELDLLMASMKSPTNLFAGFGLKKINISDYRTIAFIPVHTLQIRDICFHKEQNWVLTASMDKTFKVINNHENSILYQFTHQMPLWSCCWDENNPYELYVGTQAGSVIKYDIRQLTEAVSTFSIEGDMSPVVSVASIPAAPGETLAQGGVVSCKLNSLWLYENVNGEYRRHPISLEGPFVSMKYQANTKQLLVSSRPNSRITYARHTLSYLEKNEDKIDCNILHTFQGGGMQKLLSKSCFLSHTSDYVAAHQENCKSVFLWSINTGQKVCSVTAHESVLDLKGFQNQNGSFLVSLTDKKLEFFKFA